MPSTGSCRSRSLVNHALNTPVPTSVMRLRGKWLGMVTTTLVDTAGLAADQYVMVPEPELRQTRSERPSPSMSLCATDSTACARPQSAETPIAVSYTHLR